MTPYQPELFAPFITDYISTLQISADDQMGGLGALIDKWAAVAGCLAMAFNCLCAGSANLPDCQNFQISDVLQIKL